MTKIISVLNTKGGATKTTTCINLGPALQEVSGKTVLLVDSDKQALLANFAKNTELEFPDVIQVTDVSSMKNLKNIGASYDYVIVDGTAKDAHITSTTISVSDLVLMPVVPSPIELDGTQAVAQMVTERLLLVDYPPAYFYCSKMKKNHAFSKRMREIIEPFELPVLLTEIQEREVYRDCYGRSESVMDLKTTGYRQARVEMRSMSAEIISILEGGSYKVDTKETGVMEVLHG